MHIQVNYQWDRPTIMVVWQYFWDSAQRRRWELFLRHPHEIRAHTTIIHWVLMFFWLAWNPYEVPMRSLKIPWHPHRIAINCHKHPDSKKLIPMKSPFEKTRLKISPWKFPTKLRPISPRQSFLITRNALVAACSRSSEWLSAVQLIQDFQRERLQVPKMGDGLQNWRWMGIYI